MRLPAADLDLVLESIPEVWEELRGARLFLTGGTGFFGKWLLESLLWANDRLKLDVSVTVLSRNPAAFAAAAPHLCAPDAVTLWPGDVRNFAFPAGEFSHVVHAATEASVKLNEENPLEMLSTTTEGTARALEFAKQAGVRRFLLTSSGAVYGRQPSELTHVGEAYPGAPDALDVRSAYAHGKRTAELMCALYQAQGGMDITVARCFAFVGPHLPLDAHFAIGNFLRDALAGGPVVVGGDGTPYRSYMYAADLAAWLWAILVRGVPMRPYNVGSDEGHPIAEIARQVAKAAGSGTEVEIRRTPVEGVPPERYVPSIARARSELGIGLAVPLEAAIRRTLDWHRR